MVVGVLAFIYWKHSGEEARVRLPAVHGGPGRQPWRPPEAATFALAKTRFRQPLPVAPRTCRWEKKCGGALESLGDHRAACPTAGVLGARGASLEWAAARVCREAGARVAYNVLLRDMNIDAPALDAGRIEVLADGPQDSLKMLWRRLTASNEFMPARCCIPCLAQARSRMHQLGHGVCSRPCRARNRVRARGRQSVLPSLTGTLLVLIPPSTPNVPILDVRNW